MILLWRVEPDIWGNSATTIHRTSAVGHLHFAIRVVRCTVMVVIVVIVVERYTAVVALDEPAAGGVVLRRGQRQSGVFGERKHRLDQAFAKSGFADDQPAIVVLDGSRQNLSGRRRSAVHEYNDWIVLATIAMAGAVNLLR